MGNRLPPLGVSELPVAYRQAMLHIGTGVRAGLSICDATPQPRPSASMHGGSGICVLL